VCNLYSMTTNQEAIRRLFGIDVDATGNLPPMPGVYPDYAAPIVRNSAAGRELALARWGMPTPPKFLEGKKSDPGVTNIRNAKSPHWRRWLGVESRCLVPFTSFAEPDNGTFGGRVCFGAALDPRSASKNDPARSMIPSARSMRYPSPDGVIIQTRSCCRMDV
jgi:putative SOS response-associated peptidase YedK